MNYKIMYHIGDEISLKTKVESGRLRIASDTISISGKSDLDIPVSGICHVEMFRLHGLGRMLKILFNDKTIFMSVTRINLFGYFAVVNFFGTGQVYEKLKELADKTSLTRGDLTRLERSGDNFTE